MSLRRSVALGLGLALLAPLAAPGGAGASPAVDATVAGAKTWLLSQQQADGGFELAGFPGFETPDATLALAASFQTGPAWDAAGALAAISGTNSSASKDPLDALDKLAEASLVSGNPTNDPTNNAGAARSAKLIALVAAPLGISATDFDPSGDSASPVDLLGVLDAHKQGDGSYALGAQFNGVLFAAIALDSLGQEVPAGLVAQIKAAERPEGSWDYTGTPDNEFGGMDVDTTALALIALRSAGLGTDDDAVSDGVAWLASQQQASGAWQAFGNNDPNSTSMASLALSDLGIDTATAGWRTAFGTPAAGTYVGPETWLRTQQQSDGHIFSPGEVGEFGMLTTFATSQSIQALSRQWFLADERAALLAAYSLELGSPLAAPVATNSLVLASDTLGPNPAHRAGRLTAAAAVVQGIDGRQAAAADLFQQALNRTIDPSGKAYWSNKLTSITRPEMLSRITGSSEYYRKAGGTIPTFVDAVYQSVLGRASDPSGRAFWIKRLNDGRSVESVARSLVASNEYRRHSVRDAYDRVLDRQPTTGERDYWTAKVATTRVEVLLATLAASAEQYGALEQ
jgi:hypothetical protein